MNLTEIKDRSGEVYIKDGTLIVKLTETPRYVDDCLIHNMNIINGELEINYTKNKWKRYYDDRADRTWRWLQADDVLPEYIEEVQQFKKKWSWKIFGITHVQQPSLYRAKEGWVQLKESEKKSARTTKYIIQDETI